MFEEREMSGVFIMLLYLNFHLCNTFNKNVGNGDILSMTVHSIMDKTPTHALFYSTLY